MHNLPAYLDLHTLKTKVMPVSRTTFWRLARREHDPFPASIRVGAKRLWRTSQVLAWIERQADADHEAA